MNMKHFFRRKSSCQVAKDRLKILLISDRVNCSPEMMELIKADITKVISKYMRIDTDHMEIEIQAKRAAGAKAPASLPIFLLLICRRLQKCRKETERSSRCLKIIDCGIMTLN